MNPEMVIRFGKYKGKTVKWVMYNDRRYFSWAKQNAPQMFEEFKPETKPKILDTTRGGISEDLDKDSEVPDSREWNNPNVFFRIAQEMRERGDL